MGGWLGFSMGSKEGVQVCERKGQGGINSKSDIRPGVL